MLSVESVFYSPEGKRETAEASWSKFSSQEGDHLVLLSVYKAYKSISNSDVSVSCISLAVCSPRVCFMNNIMWHV